MLVNELQALDYLKQGTLIAVPTETVYGLAACLDNEDAILQLYQVKKRSKSNPMMVQIASVTQAKSLFTQVTPEMEKLIKTFWPGPLTIVAQASSIVPPSICANEPNVGIRMSSHPQLLSLIEKSGPLVIPSANLSGTPASIKPSHIERDFGVDFPILDGSPPSKGIESTVVGYIDGKWLCFREGCISLEEIEKVLKEPILLPKKRKRPPLKTTLVSSQEELEKADSIIGFEGQSYPQGKPFFSLGSKDKPEEIAIRLYEVLRILEEKKITKAWIDLDFPKTGLYQAIHSRIEEILS